MLGHDALAGAAADPAHRQHYFFCRKTTPVSHIRLYRLALELKPINTTASSPRHHHHVITTTSSLPRHQHHVINIT
jgi:hypothetical protein